MRLAKVALRGVNRLLVRTTGLRLVPEWTLHWQYHSAAELEQRSSASSDARRVASRINVGCGADVREGWLNVDARPIRPDDETFLCCELLTIDRHVDAGCADEVLAQDILEHFSWRDLPALLAQLTRLLRPGGRLVIQSPDLDANLRAYLDQQLDLGETQRLLYGDQTYAQNTHRNIWSQAAAADRLKAAGLVVEQVQQVGFNVRAEAVKPAP
jgi:predicted SAM-dependent methyltransferase